MLQEECCASENKTQTRWLEERKIYYTSRPAPGYLQKWHQPHSSRLWGFYASECRSKQAGRTIANTAVSLSLGGYNIAY
jgi:hypothetical protein